jgi:Cellulose biosynthesis protein BcsS
VFAVQGGIKSNVSSALRGGAARGVVVLALGLLAGAARAEPDTPHTEIFTGLEASDNYSSGYVGGGYAFGKSLYERGWRLRAVGAYGRYHYDGTLFDGADYVPTTFDGQVGFGAALIGYQFRPGALTVKLFGGVEVEDQHITPRDPNNSVQGTETGFKLLAETWYDVSERWFLSADASYGPAFQEYFSLARVGFRVCPKLSLGLEGGALGNEEYDAGRGGGFVRVDVRKLEVTLSGGFTGNYLEDDPSGYVSLGLYRKF